MWRQCLVKAPVYTSALCIGDCDFVVMLGCWVRFVVENYDDSNLHGGELLMKRLTI